MLPHVGRRAALALTGFGARRAASGLAPPQPPPAPLAPLAPLLDSFARRHDYLRISLTERCNLRCTYCMPADGVKLTPSEAILTTPEIVRVARLFVACGVRKIRLTGGEPLVRKDAVTVVRELAALRAGGLESVGMTTNGLLLARHMDDLRTAGLTHLNISLDTLKKDKFEMIARRPGFDRVRAAIDGALAAGFPSVKVNCVVMRGVNDDEVGDFAELTRDSRLDVRFIEYMPFDGNKWANSKLVPYSELLARLEARFGPLERRTDAPSDTSKGYALRGAKGSLGFITSMTEHFCGTCSRVRVLADGALKVCLFGNTEVSLRDAMRGGASDDDLVALMRAALWRKKAAHAGLDTLATLPNRPMIHIGG